MFHRSLLVARPARTAGAGDWRAIGGTTEIMRFLASEYIGSMRAWWERQGRAWPAAGASWMLDRSFDPARPPADADAGEWARRRDLFLAFRTNDSPDAATARIDLFFGGGVYDQETAQRQGLTVPPWPEDAVPEGLFADAAGRELIPVGNSGEIWRGRAFFGTVLSTFGICYTPDRLRDMGIATPPRAKLGMWQLWQARRSVWSLSFIPIRVALCGVSVWQLSQVATSRRIPGRPVSPSSWAFTE